MLKSAFAVAAFVLLTACATSAETPRRWTGTYDFHFETAAFRPEGTTEMWWVVGENAEAQAALSAAVRADPNGSPWGQAEITIEGTLSAPGHYGHMAVYDHEIHVTRVVSSRALPPS